MVDFSIIVLTYNANMKQIVNTLESITAQKDIGYEILICDDCSKENYFPKIKQMLDAKGVNKDHYQLLGSEKNQGTVKNILKGLRVATGKYAKLIGVGDLLYDAKTLRKIYDFMEENHAECCFGMMRGYFEKEGMIQRTVHVSPRDIRSYRDQDYRRIARNLLLCEDWVSGAGIFARTDYYKKYISMLEDKVLYCEDWASALAVVDNVFLSLYDGYVVWYEVGEGISTSPSADFRQKIMEDNRNFWKLFDSYRESSGRDDLANYVRKRKRKKKFDDINSILLKNVCKSVVNPDMLWYEIDVRRQKSQKLYLPSVKTTGFLDSACVMRKGEQDADN